MVLLVKIIMHRVFNTYQDDLIHSTSYPLSLRNSPVQMNRRNHRIAFGGAE